MAALLAVAVAASALLLLGWFGNEALSRVGFRERYRVPFADIRCDPPPGLDRTAFLNEVRYLSNHPDSVFALEGDERARLERAFAQHPWVESVESVAVDPGPAVTVRVKFRIPVLAVRVLSGETRLVDANGVLLPNSPTPANVAELHADVPAPGVSAGSVWPDETVMRALELVKAYQVSRLDRTGQEWRLTRRDRTILRIAN